MAITGQLFKLAWGGRLFQEESWACSMHVFKSDTMEGTSGAFQTALEQWLPTASGLLSDAAKLDFIKWNQIDPVTGKYLSTTTADTTVVGGDIRGSGSSAPGQIAACVSLTTALQRGRGHRGRIYAPAGLGWCNTDANGQQSGLHVAAMANVTATLINSINAVSTGRVVVFSKVGQIVVEVDGVECGNVVDTQRRRRSSIPEVYTGNTTAIT